jgi:hypothetical protein
LNNLINVTIVGLPSDWTLNGWTNLGDGSWRIRTSDPSILTVTTAATYAGAMVLNLTERWTNADGSAGRAVVADNVEAYAPGSPIFAVSADDHLTGSSGNDLFVFAQPIAHDTIHSFDAAADRIDLIGFTGVAGFGDLAIADDASGNAVVTLGSGETITVLGVHATALSANHFLFDVEPVITNAGAMVVSNGAILPLGGTIDNTGTIALASTGNETDLEILVRGVTLQGGGQVALSDDSHNVVFGGAADAVLTNLDNTISGAGQLGAGQMTLVNAGTINATGTNALVIDTGINVIGNSGTLQATGSGGLVVNSGVTNSGLLWADGGNIIMLHTVGGSGNALISGVAQLEFMAGSDAAVTFDTGAAGTLKLDQSGEFTGTIAGLTSHNAIDLADLSFSGGAALSYAPNGADTGGILTVSSGSQTASLALVGNYIAGGFLTTSDAHSGTSIHYTLPTP